MTRTETVALFFSRDTKNLLKRWKRRAGPDAFTQDVERFFDREAKKAAGHVSRTQLSGQKLKRRTGALARAVVGMSDRVGRAPAMRVGVLRGPALAYAKAQEEGAVIKPKRAKALAIPQAPALTRAGVARFGPRDSPVELKFIPFRSSGVAIGGLFKADTIGVDGSLERAKMYFMLVKYVVIEGKHWLRDGFREYLPQVVEHLTEHLAGRLRE